jgi:hypothetical protein
METGYSIQKVKTIYSLSTGIQPVKVYSYEELNYIFVNKFVRECKNTVTEIQLSNIYIYIYIYTHTHTHTHTLNTTLHVDNQVLILKS